MVVTPEQLVAGSPATVEAQVANVGNASGTYRAILSVDGKEIDGKELSLSAGDKEEVSFSHLFQTPGSAELTIGAHSIKVNVVKPAQLQVLSLSVTPPLVFPGKQATVTAEVTNAGEAPGELLVSMEVDGVEADNRPLILLPGAIESVSFSVIKNTPGNYEVGIGNHSVSLTVPELETYRNEIFLYSVSYPSDWSLDDSLGPEVVSFRYPDEIGFIEIDTLIVPSGTGLDDQYDTWLPAIQANLPGFQVALRTPVEENGELVAYEFEGSYQNLRVFGAISGKGRWSWVRWTGIQEPFFETNKSLLRSVLSSFTPPVVTTATYVNLDEGFTLTLPPRWDGRETGGSPFLTIDGPQEEPFVSSAVQVFSLGEPATAQEIAHIRSETDPGGLSDFRIISQKAAALGPETQGYEVIFTWTEDGVVVKGKDVVVVRGTSVYAIYALAAQDTYDRLALDIDSLISSFTLQEPMPFGVSRQDSLFLAGGTILTLDPALYRGSAAGHVGSIFSGLVTLDRNLDVIPDLAERWEVSEDGTVYTFFLRRGLQFHNGKRVTARDVEYSLERAADPATESPKPLTFLGDIVGVKEKLEGNVQEITGLEVIDDLTLRVTIDGPKPYFLQKLTYPTAYVVDRVNVQSGKTWTKRPNGTGPFKLKEWVEDEILILERNDLYYRGSC